MKTKRPPNPCSATERQLRFDEKNGRTTPQARIEFIRRSCVCDHYREWRSQLGMKTSVMG